MTWTNAGGDFASTPSGSTAVGGVGSYTWTSTALMVADVQRWLDTPSQSWGWLLMANESGPSSKRFDTKEDPTPAQRPRLVIQYLPKASVAGLGIGCAGVLPAPPVHVHVGLPTLGNAAFTLAVTGGPAGAPCTFVFATAAAAAPIAVNPLNPSCLLYLDPAALVTAVPGVLGATGLAVLPLPVPNLPALAASDCVSQVGIAHQASPGVLLVSNAMVSRPGI